MALDSMNTDDIAAVVHRAIADHPDITGRTLAILHDIQGEFRYLPIDAIDLVSRELDIPFSSLIELIGSFRDFSMEPVGRHLVLVCDGTACHAAGSTNIVSALEESLGIKCGETSPDGEFTLRTVFCVGSCGLAPIVIVDTESFGKVRLTEASKIPEQVKRRETKSSGAQDDGASL